MGFDFVKDLKKGWLPNTLTLIGVLCIPWIIYSHVIQKIAICGFFFAIAWIMDYLDGKASRVYGQTSQTGAFFDPLADKIFTISMLIYCWVDIPAFISVPVIAIGVALTSLRIYKVNYGKKKDVEYSIMAAMADKLKTNVEKIAFAILLVISPVLVSHGLITEATGILMANIFLSISLVFAGFSLAHQLKTTL